MKVWVVTETNWSCDVDGNEDRSVEVIGVYDGEEKAKEECEMMTRKTKQYWGNWEYDYEEFEVK